MAEEYERRHITDLFAEIAGTVLRSVDNAKYLVIQSHPTGIDYDPKLVKYRRNLLKGFVENSDLPPHAQQAIKGYLEGTATVQQATEALTVAENTYLEMFSKLGITPKDTEL